MRKKIIAGNWKMNKTHSEGVTFIRQLFKLVEGEEIFLEETDKKLPEIVIAPSFILLSDSVALMHACDVKIAAQNCSSENEGAYTGEVSAAMLQSISIDYVILGHSERRNYFQETNAIVAKKIDCALKNNLSVICCVGESLSERELHQEFKVINKQLEDCLFHIPAEQMNRIVVAYEPVWAIGTGQTASPAQAQEMHKHIRSVIATKFGRDISENISLLYGGSCNPKNADSIFSQPDVDGGLIGAASLDVQLFVEMIKKLCMPK